MNYAVDPSKVSHERLQDEVIIISMATGAYYTGSGTAADLWTIISGGTPIDRTAAILAAAYAADEADVLKDVQACVSFLRDREVIHETEHAGETTPVIKAAASAWTAPTFDEYTDMWDLIQLDPVHDGGDEGWPFSPP